MKSDISKSIIDVRGRIANACNEYERRVDDISIVAVTKSHPVSAIKMAVAAGIHNIGESKVQEAEKKFALLEPGTSKLHMIGHLQSNKAKKAVQLFDVIQSIDSHKLAQEISRHAVELNKEIECLIEVNCSGESQKHGVAPDDTLHLVEAVAVLPNITLTGLMTIGPLSEDENDVREAFRLCHNLFEEAKKLTDEHFEALSMGMSDDFELAIAEGATLLRIGSAIFGSRTGNVEIEPEESSE